MRRIGKMKKIIVSLSFVALFLGCNRQELESVKPVSDVKTILTIGVDESKTILGDLEGGARQLYWANGDVVNVNGHDSAPLSGIAEGCTSTTFSFDTLLDTPYDAVYPGGIYESPTQVTLPALAENTIFPLAGRSMTPKFGLGAITSVLKLSVKQSTDPDKKDTHKLARIEVTSATQQLSGLFDIDFDVPAITPASDAADDKKVAIAGNWTLSETTETDFFIPVPAGEYGFTVKLTDAKGHYMTVSTTSDKKFEVGQIKPLKTIVFEPTGTDLDVVISSAQDLIDFATAYNSGAYYDQGDPIVGLANNITFTQAESDEFSALGGIGTEKLVIGGVVQKNEKGEDITNYFNGDFYGKPGTTQYTISGYQGSVPLFGYTGGAGNIYYVVLDNTCAITIAANAPDIYHGALVGRHKGLLQNCTSDANFVISNLADIASGTHYYGGLVGRNYGGTIDGCTMNGDVTCSQAVSITNTDNPVTQIGGISGGMADNGTITGCHFNGNITISDGTTYGGVTTTGKSGANDAGLNFDIGGIVGYAANGSISNCSASTSTTTPVTKMDIRGQFVPGLGGIVGWGQSDVTVSECHNYMEISYASNAARAMTTPGRLGGVAGRLSGLASECTNSAAISSECNSTTLYLGGIVADGINLTDCTNYAGGTLTRNPQLTTAQANRYLKVGGIMGSVCSSGDVSGCKNYADILCNTLGTSTATTLDMGGIVGSADNQVDLSKCENHGKVTLDNSEAGVVAARIAIGGVLGYNAIANSTVLDCKNAAKIYAHYASNAAYGATSVGGIVGMTAQKLTISGSVSAGTKNEGEILLENLGTGATLTADVAGVLGTASGQVQIDSCANAGTVSVENSTSGVAVARVAVAGVLGYGSTAGTSITNCENSKAVAVHYNKANPNGPTAIAGIAAVTAASCTLTDCSNKNAQILCDMVGNGTATTIDVAGILAWGKGQTTITGTNKGDTYNSGNIKIDGGDAATAYARTSAGGIAGFIAGASSKISNTMNSAQIDCLYSTKKDGRVSYVGGIVGVIASLTYNSDGSPKSFGSLTDVEISNSDNTGVVYSNNFDNSAGNKTAAFAGGIAGAISGSATSKAHLHGCTATGGRISPYRGISGGICAYASYGKLEGNSASAQVGRNTNASGSGGILGSGVNATEISDCTYTGSVGNSANVGGIAYSMAGGSISGCKVNGATITSGATSAAVLLSTASGGVAITNCGVKGTLLGATITTSSTMVAVGTSGTDYTISGTYQL